MTVVSLLRMNTFLVPTRDVQVASFVSPVPYFDPSTGRLTPSGGGPMTLPVLLHSTLVHAQ